VTNLARWGFVALMGPVIVSLVRCAFYVDKVMQNQPVFALLFIRSSTFYLATQLLGIVLLVTGFLLIRKDGERRRRGCRAMMRHY
jgi:hypothetical protein